MPELPEMETYKKLLNEKISGNVISHVIVNREKTININVEPFQQQLLNKKVLQVKRRAKHLIFELDSGMNLLLHLMLGGWIYFGNEQDEPDRTKQVILSFPEGNLYFIGLRLGYLHLLNPQQLQGKLSEIGQEPLDPNFTYDSFLQLIASRRGMLKTTLINQSFLAGIGNCYSDEICFQAKLKPTNKFNDLNELQTKNLYHSIITILQSGIQQGGYMDSPFTNNDPLTGGYRTLVYDKEGQPCPRCNTPIILEHVSSKKTFYCRICQL
ncbi:Fpg/Nei family DNA glycosylase [Alkalihalobacterium alkalinitrilicum]|uniref:Fpg/Nei family DNA glycosylase n=1 Tax=Alkalihalobacterium alkalinitrilicum TaxID=427920 RepID=UPI0009959585|nr:DNA-formamidopyrimidine glycosylase family protein [Alkalihalobacterium alkalinitrilicum]